MTRLRKPADQIASGHYGPQGHNPESNGNAPGASSDSGTNGTTTVPADRAADLYLSTFLPLPAFPRNGAGWRCWSPSSSFPRSGRGSLIRSADAEIEHWMAEHPLTPADKAAAQRRAAARDRERAEAML